MLIKKNVIEACKRELIIFREYLLISLINYYLYIPPALSAAVGSKNMSS